MDTTTITHPLTLGEPQVEGPLAVCPALPSPRVTMSDHNDPLTEAFDRLDDFLAVQQPDESGTTTTWDARIEALRCLQESVGIGERERALVRGRLATLSQTAGPGAPPPVSTSAGPCWGW